MDIITFPINLLTTGGLSILLHGVISLLDALSYDKMPFDLTEKIKLNPICLLFSGIFPETNHPRPLQKVVFLLH